MKSNPLIVADAGPLIVFARIGVLSLLSELFEQVLVPEAVIKECTTPTTAPGATEINQAVKAGALTVTTIQPSSTLHSLERVLDDGEAAAIALAEQKNCSVLIDEKKGRKAAIRKNIDIVGSGMILVKAKQKGLISEVAPLLEKMKQCGYRLSTDIYHQILKIASEE